MKIHVATFIIITSILNSSCSELEKNDKDKNNLPKKGEIELKKINGVKQYFITLVGENGDNTKEDIEFTIDKVIIDSLKLKSTVIKNICKQALIYADWDVKFKPTYKHENSASLYYKSDGNKIYAFIDGTAKNAYGVTNDIFTGIPFTLKGKMMNDEYGFPDIISH
jgi:hypothetical protein